MNAIAVRSQIAARILSRPTIWFGAILACCLGQSLHPALAAPGSWTLKAPMPMAFATHAACAVDGILYVVGGDTGTNIQSMEQLRILFAYDPKTDMWSRKTEMQTARRWPAACVVDGIIYAIGGGGMADPVTGAVEAYDPKTDSWVAKTEMPTARCGHGACAVGGIIYTIGGVRAVGGNPVAVPIVEAYDPKTDQWTTKAQLPTAASFLVARAVNGVIYAFAGKGTFAYYPQTDSWTTKAPIPNGSLNCRGSASSVADGIVYLFGGDSADLYTTYDLTLAYDPVQDKFTAKRKIPMKSLLAAAVTIDGKIYLTGGANADLGAYANNVLYDTLCVFDPQGGVTPQFLSLSRESPDRVRLAWQGEAGRLYGVQSKLDLAKGPWARVIFSTGTNTILATNALVEATCPVPSGDTQRFFQVIEAN